MDTRTCEHVSTVLMLFLHSSMHSDIQVPKTIAGIIPNSNGDLTTILRTMQSCEDGDLLAQFLLSANKRTVTNVTVPLGTYMLKLRGYKTRIVDNYGDVVCIVVSHGAKSFTCCVKGKTVKYCKSDKDEVLKWAKQLNEASESELHKAIRCSNNESIYKAIMQYCSAGTQLIIQKALEADLSSGTW